RSARRVPGVLCGQGHLDRRGRGGPPASSEGVSVGQDVDDADQAGADPEKVSAGAEGDIICHDFNPRWGWTVTGPTRTSSSRPARSGAPWRPSQTLLRPANRSA